MTVFWVVLISFLLFAVFLCLGVSGFRRAKEWYGTVRTNAVVTDIKYQETRESAGVISDASSYTEVKFQFMCEGLVCERTKKYDGIMDAPGYIGQKIPIRFNRNTGAWILQKELRPYWVFAFMLAPVCLFYTVLFLTQGERFLSLLEEFTVESPNMAGEILYVTFGSACFAAGCLCLRYFLPHMFKPVLAPAWRLLKYITGSFEQVEGRYVGSVCQSTSDSSSYFPMFAVSGAEGEARWVSLDEMPRKKYKIGKNYPLYRDRRSGRYYLKSSGTDISGMIFGLLPLVFSLLFVVSLLVFGAGLTVMGVQLAL